MEETDEQLVKRYRKRGLGGSRAQELLSRAVGVLHPPGTWMCSHPGSSLGFLEASSHRYDPSLTPFSPL